MTSRQVRIVGCAVLVLVAGCFVLFRYLRDKQHAASIEQDFTKYMGRAVTNWQQLECKATEAIAVSNILEIPIRLYSVTLSKEQEQLLRDAVFRFINCYRQTNAEPFLAAWSDLEREIDPEAIPYLTHWAPGVQNYSDNGLAEIWKTVNRTNRMTYVALSSSSIDVGMASNAVQQLYNRASADLAKAAGAKLSQAAIPTVRSIFIVHPSPEELRAQRKSMLYAKVMLYVRYNDSTRYQSERTLTTPLGVGFYWSEKYFRWVPHAKVFVLKTGYETLF